MSRRDLKDQIAFEAEIAEFWTALKPELRGLLFPEAQELAATRFYDWLAERLPSFELGFAPPFEVLCGPTNNPPVAQARGEFCLTITTNCFPGPKPWTRDFIMD